MHGTDCHRPSRMKTFGARPVHFPETADAFKQHLSSVQRRVQRQRRNGPIQGTVADLMKIAIHLMHESLAAMGAQIVLFVHDELLIEVGEHESRKALLTAWNAMHGAMRKLTWRMPAQERVAMRVKADIRTTWSDDDVIHDHNSPAKW